MLMLLMIFAHILLEYPLQGERLLSDKNRHQGKRPLSDKYDDEWLYPLLAHSVLNGIAVYLILGVWWLCLLEIVTHAYVDDLKCRGEITFSTEQSIHIITKAIWYGLFVIFI